MDSQWGFLTRERGLQRAWPHWCLHRGWFSPFTVICFGSPKIPHIIISAFPDDNIWLYFTFTTTSSVSSSLYSINSQPLKFATTPEIFSFSNILLKYLFGGKRITKNILHANTTVSGPLCGLSHHRTPSTALCLPRFSPLDHHAFLQLSTSKASLKTPPLPLSETYFY